jgi:preprotein translocase subunit SecB
MTDQSSGAPVSNGSAAGTGAEGAAIRVLAQYVKDLSFENPGAPNTLQTQTTQPKIDLQLDVNARRLEEDGMFEVVLRINARSERDTGEVLFVVELEYAGLFAFANIPADVIEPLVLVECPRMLFPFAREIVATATRNGGFPPLMIDPMDFGTLYAAQRQAQAQAQNNPVGQA